MTKQINFFRMAAMAVMMLALFSCSKTNKQGAMVPKNASVVVHINGAQLAGKINWDEIKSNEMFKEAMTDTTEVPSYVKDVLNDPDKSGIDLKQDLVFFAVLDGDGAYTCLAGSVKDAEKFSQFNLDLISGGFKKEDKGFTYISKKPMIVGYNKEKFIYLSNTPEMNEKRRRNGNAEGATSRDLQAAVEKLFALSEKEALASNEKFSALMADKADAHFWINSEELINNSGALDEIPFSLDKFTKGNISTASFTFNNGNINIKSKWYASKELSEIFKKYKGGNIDETMLAKLPTQKMNFLFGMNFKPEGIKEILKLTGMDGLISGLFKKATSLSIDDFIKANKGDLLIAGSNLRNKKDTAADEMEMYSNRFNPDIDYIFSASINDKATFAKLIEAAQKNTEFLSKSEGATLPAYGSNDKYFAIGTTKAMVDNYLTGKGNNTDAVKLVGKGPIVGYADIQSFLQAGGPATNLKDSTEREMYNLSLQIWDNALLNGGNIEDGALAISIDINLKDKNTNSLKQLSTYAQKMSALEAAKRKKEMAAFQDEFGPGKSFGPDAPVAAPVEELPSTQKKNN